MCVCESDQFSKLNESHVIAQREILVLEWHLN